MSELLDELAERFELTDRTPRYAPAEVILAGFRLPVLQYVVHPAGREGGPIYRELPKLELVTAHGSRWYGILRGYINSELRMVVEGTNPRDEVRMGWEVVPEDRRG